MNELNKVFLFFYSFNLFEIFKSETFSIRNRIGKFILMINIMPWLVCGQEQESKLNISSNNISSTLVNISISKDHSVYVNNMKIEFYHEITSLVSKMKPLQIISLKSVITGHPKVDYQVVDNIKEELGRFLISSLVEYNIEGNKDYSSFGFIDGTTLNHFSADYVGPLEGKKIEYTISDNSSISAILSEEDVVKNSFRDKLYNLEIKDIKKTASMFNIANITVLPKSRILFESQIFLVDNLNLFNRLMFNYDFILVRFDRNINYKEYLEYLDVKNSLVKSALKQNPSSVGNFLEVSNRLSQKLLNAGIDI
ncbi:hypothetical protein ABN763_05415 [Spongiivirga sp. MCCC 1A20706]|uniref:hypothetical protein n=1 Tax=Spongiivirga sp. MCCC 1A20706 TaxID=3160963 RepID=UPI003977643A